MRPYVRSTICGWPATMRGMSGIWMWRTRRWRGSSAAGRRKRNARRTWAATDEIAIRRLGLLLPDLPVRSETLDVLRLGDEGHRLSPRPQYLVTARGGLPDEQAAPSRHQRAGEDVLVEVSVC